MQALFDYARAMHPAGLKESKLNWLLDYLDMPRFIDILEFLDGRFESTRHRIPVRMFTDDNGTCHAYLISFKGRKTPRVSLNLLYTGLKSLYVSDG